MWDGAPKTYVLPEARHWWQRAADAEHLRAMTLLGCALARAGELAGR